MLVYYTIFQHKRIVYEEAVVSTEEFSVPFSGQMRRRARIVSRNLNMLWKVKKIFNPFEYGLFPLNLLIHKVLRWFSPFFILAIFVLNIILTFRYSQYVLGMELQCIFYGLAILHLPMLKLFKRNFKILSLPFFFVMSNLGMGLGFVYFLRGHSTVKWEVQR